MVLVFALFEEVPGVPIVENFLKLKVLLHYRILDLLLQLKSKSEKLRGREVDFLVLDRKLKIHEVRAILVIVFGCHEKFRRLQSILNHF